MATNYNFSDVFISYSRKDSDFVRSISDALKAKGYEIWVDWEDIPQTTDWWNEIKAGIDASDTFAFFLSPSSATSEVCYKEVQYAVDNNKRIVPILCHNIDDKETLDQAHPKILSHNWFVFHDDTPFEDNLNNLVDVMTMDIEYIRRHTRFLVRAHEWKNRDRNDSFLLRGTDAREAMSWLSLSHSKTPQPLPIQIEYIHACERQFQLDNILEHQKNALRFIERRTIPTFSLTFFVVWYYIWTTLPADIFYNTVLEGRNRVEITFGMAITASTFIGLLVLYGEELVILRYQNSKTLRLGLSFVMCTLFSSIICGFLQISFFGMQYDWITVLTGALGFGISSVLRATFKLNGLLSFLIAFISIYITINITYATPATMWDSGRIPLFFFNTVAEVQQIGLPMALLISIGMYLWPMTQDIAKTLPHHIQEKKIIKWLVE